MYHRVKIVTGMVVMPYCALSVVAHVMDFKGRHYYQYNTIVLAKVELVEQCKTGKKETVKTWRLKTYEVASYQGMTLSPSAHCRRRHDWGESHHKSSHASSRVSEKNKLDESDNSNKY